MKRVALFSLFKWQFTNFVQVFFYFFFFFVFAFFVCSLSLFCFSHSVPSYHLRTFYLFLGGSLFVRMPCFSCSSVKKRRKKHNTNNNNNRNSSYSYVAYCFVAFLFPLILLILLHLQRPQFYCWCYYHCYCCYHRCRCHCHCHHPSSLLLRRQFTLYFRAVTFAGIVLFPYAPHILY